jgi:omega-6 fatty acid desaturase (delta-12 desaturase)
MHDCGHNSFFKSSRANAVVGTLFGTEVNTPFLMWRRGHNYHHQTSGDISVVNFGMAQRSGDTIVLTKDEYESMPKLQKVFVRIVREPWVFFTLIPMFTFAVVYRFGENCGFVNATILAKLAIVLLAQIDVNLVWMEFFAVWMSSVMGFMLFHTQHGANSGYRVSSEEYDRVDAAIKGATFLQVPWFLKWATLGIEYHHVHHLNSRVPCYGLKGCHDEGVSSSSDTWKYVNHLSLMDAFRCLSNVMWDVQEQKYVPFPKT